MVFLRDLGVFGVVRASKVIWFEDVFRVSGFGVFTDFMALGFRGQQVFRSFCSRVAFVLVARVLAYKLISKIRFPIAFVSY